MSAEVISLSREDLGRLYEAVRFAQTAHPLTLLGYGARWDALEARLRPFARRVLLPDPVELDRIEARAVVRRFPTGGPR